MGWGMKDFQKFLGLGCGVGIAVALWTISNKLDGRVVETLLAVFVTGITLAILVIAVAYVIARLNRGFDISPQQHQPYQVSTPTYDASKVFAAGVPAGYLPPVVERKWEFKDGSEQHMSQIAQGGFEF